MKATKPFEITSKYLPVVINQLGMFTDFGRTRVVVDCKGNKYKITSANYRNVAWEITLNNSY
jgi:hypothetical protein